MWSSKFKRLFSSVMLLSVMWGVAFITLSAQSVFAGYDVGKSIFFPRSDGSIEIGEISEFSPGKGVLVNFTDAEGRLYKGKGVPIDTLILFNPNGPIDEWVGDRNATRDAEEYLSAAWREYRDQVLKSSNKKVLENLSAVAKASIRAEAASAGSELLEERDQFEYLVGCGRNRVIEMPEEERAELQRVTGALLGKFNHFYNKLNRLKYALRGTSRVGAIVPLAVPLAAISEESSKSSFTPFFTVSGPGHPSISPIDGSHSRAGSAQSSAAHAL